MALAMHEDTSDEMLNRAHDVLLKTRPTAVNLQWALDDVRGRLEAAAPEVFEMLCLLALAALAEGREIGAKIDLPDAGVALPGWFFGEDQARYLISAGAGLHEERVFAALVPPLADD